MVKIIADTTSSIPPIEASRLGLAYLPQIIIFGDDSYRDDCEIDTHVFLQKLRASKMMPKTAAPPPALYNPIFKQAYEMGESMIVICPSAELSGTFRSATVAAQDFPEADIRIIDTKTIGSGLGTLVSQAVQWAQAGLDAESIEAKVKEMAAREQVYFLVDTLEYLHKGGRIGGAQALLGSILQVKPILMLKNGRAEAAESQRTKKRALKRLHEIIQSQYPVDGHGYLTVMQGDAREDADLLALELKAQFGCEDIRVYEVPPAIIVHAGPGVLAVSFFRDHADEMA
jgi:DegV family protein with EDD domain